MDQRLEKFIEFTKSRFSIDYRALGVFRISLGIIIIVEILMSARKLKFFYTEAGVVPISLAKNLAPRAYSLYFLSGDTVFVTLLFLATLFFGLLMALGYRTRIAAFFSFLLMASLDIRNGLVASYADTVIRHLLLWSIFLPLNRRYSIDSVIRDFEHGKNYIGLAGAGVLLQIFFLYFNNGFLKMKSEIWTSGKAAALVLGRDSLTYFIGDYVSYFPNLLILGGKLWVAVLILSPALILYRGRLRSFMAYLLMAMEFVLVVTVKIGMFSYANLAGLVNFLQPHFWDYLENKIPPEVFMKLAEWAKVFPDRFYYQVPLSCPQSASIYIRLAIIWGKKGLLSILIINMVIANLGTLGAINPSKIPGQDAVTSYRASLSVDEPSWTVFTPNPGTEDSYFLVAGKFSNGSLIDIYNGGKFSWERPSDKLNNAWKTYRFRFYMEGSLSAYNVARHYSSYHCELRNNSNQRLTHLSIFHVTENITLQNINNPGSRPRKIDLYHSWGCGNREPRQITNYSELPAEIKKQ